MLGKYTLKAEKHERGIIKTMTDKLKEIDKLSDEEKEKVFQDFEQQRKDFGLDYMDMENIMYEHHLNYQGQLRVSSPININLIYWSLINNKAIKLINEYVVKYQLAYKPVNVSMYVKSGRVLSNVPLVKEMDEAKIIEEAKMYTVPHWLPVEFVPIDELD